MFIKRKRIILVLLSSLFVGGCQMSDEQSNETKPVEQKPSEVAVEDLPNTRALQDEFTREMIKSTKETEKGYYTLESKTGVYEMLFPAGGGIDGIGYTRKGESSEAFLAGILYNDKTEALLRIKYTNALSNDETGIGYAKELLTNSIGEDMKFDRIDGKGKVTYVAPFTMDEGLYGYAAYIHPDKGWGGVEVVYSASCVDNLKSCNPQKEKFKKRAYKLISSVKFLNKNEAKK
ncbi:hypothetical protein JF536_13395 [Priestia flexa]|uniref:hypothetical protein n=1 Tax=Priestia flexa TaxID=86664 RepID=UPI001A8EFA87|nr:hypothetical protein [Priestia flexa]MBN8435086.1 hypothetical protein [Priestia flexa]MCA0967411.1 hypothetical protein [Priestia flexa]